LFSDTVIVMHIAVVTNVVGVVFHVVVVVGNGCCVAVSDDGVGIVIHIVSDIVIVIHIIDVISNVVGVIHIVVVAAAATVVLWIPHEILQEGVRFVFHM